MQYQVKVGSLGWIDEAGPWPFQPGAGAMADADQAWQGDLNESIVKTYFGLAATSNSRPPSGALDFQAYRAKRNYRAMAWAWLRYDDAAPGPTAAATFVGSKTRSEILDPGWTPPVDLNKVGSMQAILYVPWMREQADALRDPQFHKGDESPLSGIHLDKQHLNSVFPPVGGGEKLIASGMLRFRAGGVTDDRGIRFAGAPYHIPWVWVEFLLTSIGNGSVRLRGAASIFPTIAWYLNDKQVRPPHPQTTDTSFPRSFWTGKVAEKELRIWPVLACGIPRSLPLPPPSSDAAFAGKRIPITALPNTCPGTAYVDVQGAAFRIT